MVEILQSSKSNALVYISTSEKKLFRKYSRKYGTANYYKNGKLIGHSWDVPKKEVGNPKNIYKK